MSQSSWPCPCQITFIAKFIRTSVVMTSANFFRLLSAESPLGGALVSSSWPGADCLGRRSERGGTGAEVGRGRPGTTPTSAGVPGSSEVGAPARSLNPCPVRGPSDPPRATARDLTGPRGRTGGQRSDITIRPASGRREEVEATPGRSIPLISVKQPGLSEPGHSPHSFHGERG